LHSPRVALCRAICRFGEVEALEQFIRSLATRLCIKVIEAAHDFEVLAAGQLFLNGSGLASEAGDLSHGSRGTYDIATFNEGAPAIGEQQRRQDLDRGRLSSTVRAKKTEDAAAFHDEIDAAQCLDVAE
jgi:hypothetical protein